MSQSRRIIEQLVLQGTLSIDQADSAATQLEVYPTRQSWLAFFDKALLIMGAVAMVLALVFFIAYNWLTLGKLGKFALVEGALIITMIAYAWLAIKDKFTLIQQLLLFIASVITGSLLALFGQVYQTGADTWQLFFNWALLIIPWVLIARLPALWLLFLGLLNFAASSYLDLSTWRFYDYDQAHTIQLGILAAINLTAFVLWIACFDNRKRQNLNRSQIPSQNASTRQPTSSTPPHSMKSFSTLSSRPSQNSPVSHHWSSYVVAVVSAYYASRLAMLPVWESPDTAISIATIVVWLSWCTAMYWYFRTRAVDLFMLTCLCFSLIAVILVWVGEMVSGETGLITLFVLVLIMSSLAVAWLRKVGHDSKGGQHA